MPLFGPPNIAKLQAKKDVDGLVKALGYQKDWHIPSAAATALGQIGGARAVDPLIAALEDPATSVRESAAAALGQIGDARAVDPLIAAFKEPSMSNAAATALGQIGDARAVEPLTAALTEKLGFRSVAEALDGLGWRPDNGATGAAYWAAKGEWDRCVEIGAAAVEVLIALLEKRDQVSSWAVAEALGRIGDPRAVEPLIAALREPRDPNADANFESWRKSGFEALGAAMRDGPVMMRARAAEALGRIGDVRAVEPLIAASRGGEDAVRQAATEALSKIGGARAVAASLEDVGQTAGGEVPTVVGFESIAPGKTQRAIELCQEYMDRDHPMDATMQMLGVKRTKPTYRVVQGKVGRESQPHIDMMIVSVASCLPGEDVDASDTTAIARMAFDAIEHYASLQKVQAFFLLPYRIRTKTVVEGSPIPPEEECAVYSGVENLLLEIYEELPGGGTITDDVVERKIDELIKSVQ